MFGIDKLTINYAFSSVYFYLGLILIAAYTYYNYRYTVPQVNSAFRYVLIVIRTLALLLILFTIFEPILSIARRKVIEPVNLVFVDDSKSIKIDDGTGRMATVEGFLHKISSTGSIKNSAEIYSFGSKVSRVSPDSLGKINFSESSTNISKVFGSIKTENRNISSIVMISDGVITDGSNPVFQAERLGIPVYTVGVGDTSKRNNLEVRRVLFNEYVYSGTPTTINVTIASAGFKGKAVPVTLYENNRQIAQQNVTLSDEGMTNLNFTYTAQSPGEKKMNVALGKLEGEFTYADNNKPFYLNVLNNKINALIISGSPSPDLSFVRNSLMADENLRVATLTQIGPNRFLENVNQTQLIDSSGIIFLVGFPTSQTPERLLTKVQQEIRDKNKPFLIILSEGVDYNRLKVLQPELPFTIGRITAGYTEAQPLVTANEMQNPLLQNNATNVIDAWNNLPPVSRTNTELVAKPESNVLSRIRVNNVPLNNPLIVTRKLGNKKSAAIMAKNIWRWKLETSEKKLDIFDRLMLSGTKWLNTSEEQKLFTIRPTKKIYSLGEPVEFTAQVYNETLNPVDDAEVKIGIKSEKNEYNVLMNSIGGGLYEGKLETNDPGDYTYSGTARLNGQQLGKDAGRFSIGDVEIEMINPGMDKDLLELLSRQTGGRFFYGKNYDELFNILNEISKSKVKEKVSQSEIILWSSQWMLLGIIVFFAAEWFLRKRSGML
ncbi:MAG TPA: vWA domain-containing protein [Ignavibacteriales bacterium]|nr:vWA domain-containing protein [Ignavibacteriales bacterium]